MTRRSSRLTFLVLCVSIMGRHLTKSSAQGLPPLPPICTRTRLENPVRCGCYGYEDELEDPQWSVLREECTDSLLGGNIDNGRRFCNSTFIDNGVVQRNELQRFFNFTLYNCAARIYDIDIPADRPYPTYGPSARFVEVSPGHRRTNYGQYFGQHADVPSYQTVSMRMHIAKRSRNRIRSFCLSVSYYRNLVKGKARIMCG